MASLPAVDISDFLADPASPSAREFVADLCTHCHDPGFVYLTGHGVDPLLEQRLLDAADQFFALPDADRAALAIENSAAFRGYTILGDERTGGRADWRDQLDYGPEQLAPPPDADPAWLRLRGPNQWPPSVPELRTVALDWLDAMHRIGVAVLRALATGLELPHDFFDRGFIPDHDIHAKIIRYPGREATTENGQGVGLHHDTGLLTFILQSDVAGLQVMIDDTLVTAEPMAGSYVLNLGAMMQAVTAGYLRATPHRVVSPPADKARISIALFFNPTYQSTFEPIELPERFAAVATPDLNDLNGDTIRTLFGENNLKVRMRSHPDVARRHYADVLGGHAATR